MLDPRLNAYRSDIADARLRGKVKARKFVKGIARQVIVPVASVLKSPAKDSTQTSQALLGETCRVFENRKGYAFVQLDSDGYVGYIASAALGPVVRPTQVVAAVATYIYPKPDLKTQPAIWLPMGARVRVTKVKGNYAAIAGGGFIFVDHLLPAAARARDFVAVAEQFLHAPYYWGGKTIAGIDCSGLVQVALPAAPRDSDMQEQALGRVVKNHARLKRGDLVFWPGHVGIMQSPTQLLHANGAFMQVTSEPLRTTIKRIGRPRTVKRP